MVVSSEAAAAWWWIYIAFCHHYESCPHCFFLGSQFSKVSLVDWDQTSNQIKSKMIILWFYFVISFFQCANKARKDANSGYLPPPPPFLRTLSAPTEPYLESLLCVLLPSQHHPQVATVANVAKVPLNSQRQPGYCKFANSKGRYDWPKSQIRPLVKM